MKRVISIILLSLFASLVQSMPSANAVGAATQLVLTRSAVGPASGSAFTTQPQLTLQDASGATVTGSALVVSATFSGKLSTANLGIEMLIGTQTATIDAATGIATFQPNFGISGVAGRTYTLTFSATSVASATQSITVTTGEASKLLIQKASAGTTSGVAFTTQPQVAVVDSGNNIVTGFATDVSVAITAGAGGSLQGASPVTVNPSTGIASFTNLGITGTSGATYTLTYSSSTSGPIPVTASITVGTTTAPGFPNLGGDSSSSTSSLLIYNFPVPDNGGSDITSYEYQWVTATSGNATPTGTWITYPAPETQSGLVILSFDISLIVRAVAPEWNFLLLRSRNAVGTSNYSTTGYRNSYLGSPIRQTDTAPTSTTSIMSGATLTNQMTFSGPAPITYAYEWQRCEIFTTSSCAVIADATNSTYALTDADVGKFIRSRVIATNSYGSSSTGSSSRSSLTSAVLTNSGPDTTAPTITSVNSTTNNGSYKVGDSISIRVNFSENVTVTGTPRLTLETGNIDRAVNYASGTGTNQLIFTYTVQAGDTAADLDYISTSALDLNGGTLKDAAENNATLTLAAPGSSNSLGANKAIVIDTTAPAQTISAIDISADTGNSASDFTTSTASQTITATLSATLGANETLWGSLDGGSTFTDISASVSTMAISWTSTTLSGSSSIKFQVRDLAGNVGATATQSYELDTTTPTQTISAIDISADTGSSVSDFLTATASQTITGTLSANLAASESLWGSVDGGINYSNVSAFVSGTAVSWTSATLSGTSSIKFQVRDLAGNVGATATQSYELDSTAPTQTISGIDISADTGSSASDFITLTASQTITATLSANLGSGEALWGSIDGGVNYVDVSSSVIGTAISWVGRTLDGSKSIRFQVRDSAGATGTTATQFYVLDTTAPTPTVATSSVTTATGVTVRSSEIGTAYLVKSTVMVNNLASITGAANDNYNEVTVSAANTDTTMSTAGLVTGDYKLYVIDAAGNLSIASDNSVTVAVAAAPSVTSTAAPTGTASIGSTLTNAVTFSGVPTPALTYQWKSCTSAIDTATACSDISGATSSNFIASAIELVGKFIRVLVTAINGISPDAAALSSPTSALVPVAPGVPILGTPTRGDLQINIPVTAPTSNGGSAILKYQFSTDGGATWMDRTDTATVSSPIVIKYLSTDGTTPIVSGTTYPIQIRAVNSASSPNGLGTASVSVTAAAAPSAPTAISATATGQTTATVSFTAPTNNGGSAITSYTVTSSPGGVTASGSASPIAVTGLNSSTAYTFTVIANNGSVNSVASAPSAAITTFSPPPPPACDASCEAAAAKVIADKIASDTAAKVVAEKVTIDKSAAVAAAKTAVDKAAAAVVAKATADAATVNAAAVAKAAAEAQQAAIVAAENAAATLKSSTTTAAAKAAATATAVKAASTAASTVQAAAAAAKVAATAKNDAINANKQVEIALGALGSKTAAASSVAQANAIAAAAKAAANAAAKVATDAAAAAKVASNNANRDAVTIAASIATEQKLAADTALEAKIATDTALKATEEKIAAAAEAQKSAEAVVKVLDEKIALAEASVKATDLVERAAIDKKIAEINVKIVEAQRVADGANIKAEATVIAQEKAEAAAIIAKQSADTQAAKAIAIRAESIAKNAIATKAAANASLAAKIAKAAVAAAARVPSKAVISTKPSSITGKNSAQATITGLKPGQKVKVTVNVKGK